MGIKRFMKGKCHSYRMEIIHSHVEIGYKIMLSTYSVLHLHILSTKIKRNYI